MRTQFAKRLRWICFIALFTAVIAISSMISMPFGPVNLTLQLFSVYSALYILGCLKGSVCVLIYICLGIVGVPVFSGFGGGISHFLGASGGFVLGFVPLCLSYSLFYYLLGGGVRGYFVGSFVSLAVFYFCGASYYSVVFLGGIDKLPSAFAVTVLPFLLFDLLKILGAYTVGKRIAFAIDVFKRK